MRIAIQLALAALGVFGPSIRLIADDIRDSHTTAMTAVLEKWAERQKLAHSVRLTWREQRRYASGSIMPAQMAIEHGFSDEAASKGIPKDESKFTFRNDLLIRDDWMKYDTHNLRIDAQGSARLQRYTSAYDGESSRMLSHGNQTGGILDERRNVDASSYPLMPLLLNLRPLDERFVGLTTSEFQVIDDDMQIGECKCILVAHRAHRLWIDLKRSVVMRWETMNRLQQPLIQADIKYSKDPDIGWVIATWAIKRMSYVDGIPRIVETIRAQVLDYAIGLPLSREDFRIEFPAQSQIYDSTTKQEFVVTQDGGRRPVVLGQSNSAATGDVQDVTRLRRFILLCGNVALVAVLLTYFLLLKRRRSAVNSDNQRREPS